MSASLDRPKGGLLNPERQIQALHLRAFAQIRNQECEELWVCLPRFWIGSFFRTRHEKWRFLSHDNTKPHTDLLTFLWRSCADHSWNFTIYPLTNKSIYSMLPMYYYERKHLFSGQKLFRMTGPYNWKLLTTTPIPWSQAWCLSYRGPGGGTWFDIDGGVRPRF